MGVREVYDAAGSLVSRTEDKPTPAEVTEAAIREKAKAALATNTAYLGNASPSAAQVAAQVKVLTRECQALIRLLLSELDTDDA